MIAITIALIVVLLGVEFMRFIEKIRIEKMYMTNVDKSFERIDKCLDRIMATNYTIYKWGEAMTAPVQPTPQPQPFDEDAFLRTLQPGD
jgi:hypothetical protein